MKAYKSKRQCVDCVTFIYVSSIISSVQVEAKISKRDLADLKAAEVQF